MCIIIDNDSIDRVLGAPEADISTLQAALFQGRVTIVHGGKLTLEYGRSPRLIRRLAILDRAGLVRRIRDDLVDAAATIIEGVCVSNDAHIIGLARASGARLLCSEDKRLHADFRNPQLVQSPRGKVYRNNSHAALLRRPCSRRA